MFQSLLGAVRSYYLKETRNSDFYIKTHYFKYWQPIQKIWTVPANENIPQGEMQSMDHQFVNSDIAHSNLNLGIFNSL